MSNADKKHGRNAFWSKRGSTDRSARPLSVALLFLFLAVLTPEGMCAGATGPSHPVPQTVAVRGNRGRIEANEPRVVPMLKNMMMAAIFHLGDMSRYPRSLRELEHYLYARLGVLSGEAYGYYFGMLPQVRIRRANQLWGSTAAILVAVPVKDGMSGEREFMLSLGNRTAYQAQLHSRKSNAATEWVPGRDGVPLEFGEVVMYGRFPFESGITNIWKPVNRGEGLEGISVIELVRRADSSAHVPDRRYHAALSVLKQRGASGVRQVLKIARQGAGYRDRVAAVRVLARLDAPPDGPVCRGLEEILHTHPDETLGLWAAYSLVRITGRCQRYVERILAPHREEEKLDHNTVVVIARLGPKAAGAVPFLIGKTEQYLEDYQGEDEDLEMCRYCIWALGRIGPAARGAAPVLINAVEDNPRADLVPEACEALGRIGEMPEKAVPLLTRVLRRGGRKSRYYAAKGLGHFGPAARSALPALRDAMKEPDLRVIAGTAMALLERDSSEAE